MRQPKCRTCGKEHALGICPEFKKADEPKKSPTKPKEQPKVHGSSPCIGSREDQRPATYGQLVTAGETASVPKPKVGRPSTGFDRNAYQRNYMADQRKAKPLGMTVSEYRKGR